MNGFCEVSSYEGPLVPIAGEFLTLGQFVGVDLPPSGMIFLPATQVKQSPQE